MGAFSGRERARRAAGAFLGALGRQLHFVLFGGQPTCRFEPSCSRYMSEAVGKRGFFVGFALGLRRIARCLPGGKSGIDPVPAHKDLHGA